MAGFTLNGGNGPDFSKSKIMGMLNNKLDLAKNLLNNNTYKTTIEAETKGFDKAEKQVEDIKESMDELQGSIQSVQKLLKDTFGKDLKISEKAFKKYGDTLVSGSKAIKQLIDENTAAFDRSASDGKGRQQINTSYRSINSSGNLAKSLPPSLQDKYETRMNALLKSKNISEPKTVEKVAALVGQLTKVIEYQDRITGNFRKGDMDYSSVGGIYKYADTVKEIVRTHVAIADLEKQLKDLTGGSILTDKESSVRTSRSDIDIEMKSLREEMMSIMANTFAHWTPNKKGEIIPGSNRPNKFDHSMANLEKLTSNLNESLLTVQRGINASRKAPVYEEEKKEMVPELSSKPAKKTKFDKYLNMTFEKAAAELAKAFKKTEDQADARSYKDFAGIYKAFLAQGGQQSKKYDELLDFIKDEHGDYLKELDEAFSGVINKRQEQKDILQRKLLERKAAKSEEPKKSNETSRQQTETNVRETVNGTHITTKTTGRSTSNETGGTTVQAPQLGTTQSDMSGVGEAAKKMGDAVANGANQGSKALEKLEDQARKTGATVNAVNGQVLDVEKEQHQKTVAEEYDESTRMLGRKAGNIEQLREQYKLLKNLNKSINEWKTKGNALGAPFKGSLEELEKYKAELLELNPQLKKVVDSTESILPNKFKQMFGDSFPSFDALSEVGQNQSPISSEVSVLDKKVAELQYLHDKVRTIFDGKDGIINEDMSYSEKFDSSEVQRMITLLSQLSDAELQATMGIDGEEWANEFRYNLQAEINAIKELQDELQKVQDGTSTEDAEELDIRINDRLEHIYEMAQNVTKSFDSSLTPSVKEFLSLIEDNLGISSMPEFMMGNAKEIDRYINDIIHNGKSVKEVFADMENRYGWDTARFDNLIDGNVPTELKGLYDSLFSDVENRIKSAEQAAEEFNAKLREFQSNETPVLTDSFRQTDEEAQIEKIKKRTEEMMNRMQNHPDMKQFGDANIITEYITAAQKDLDKSIDDLFNEFENKLNQRKQEFIDKQQKEEAQKDNRQQFISFLRGISPTGQEEYGQNLAKYSDLFNSITDDANTLDAAINKVKQDLDSVKAPKLGNGEIPVVSDMEDTLSRSNIEAIGQQLEVPLNKIIESLAKQSGIRISEFKEKFGQTLIDIITQMKDSFSFTDSGVIKFANEVWDSFDSFVEKLGREIGAKSEKKTSIYDDFYDNYKGSKFYVSDHLKSELGEADYERMVKSGRISRTKKRGYVNPDSGIFDEMMSQYPDVLQDAAKTLDITLDNLTGPADKILVMVQALIDAKQELSKGFVPYDQLSPEAKNAAMEKGATLGLDMMRKVGDIYTEKYKPEQKLTSADELNKFLQDSKTILDSFGKTQNDIPTEWNAFLNQLQNGAITADDALKELKATLEGLKKSEPPEPPKSEPPKLEPPKLEPPKKEPKTPEPSKNPPIDDRILPPEKRTGEYSDVRHKIIQRIRNDDESWEDRYQDKSGNVWVEGARQNKKTGELEPYYKDITQYTQLEREAIQVTNDLTDAIAAQQALERKGDTSSDLYKKTQKRIDILNNRKAALEEQADEYARNHTDPSYPYTRELFNERVKKGTELHTNAVERRTADQIIKEEERKQQAIEKTNSFLDTQSTNLESARDKHVKNRTDIPADVLDELENKYADINKMISDNKDNGNMSETTSTRIQNSIKEYQTLVDIMEKNQKIAMKLSGYSPEAAKSKLGEEIQGLIQDMQLLTQVDTSDLQEKLQNIQKGLDTSKNPTSDYIKQVNQMVNAIRFDFGKKQNEFDFQKEIEKNVADYEKAAEKVGKIQAQIDFGNGENKNQLQDQLQAAKNEADELASHLEKLRGVINQTGTDEWKEKVNKKIDAVDDKYMDEKTTSSYKDAQVASQNKQYETAKKALNDYEAALRKVAEAQAALDFGDKAKKPELEANLEAAKNKARELKESLDAVKGSLLDQDRLSAEQVANNEQRMTTADDIFSDPKKSPYYQSKENTSNEKEKAAAIKELVKAYKLWQEWHSKYIKEYMNDEKRAQNKGIMDAAQRDYLDLRKKYVNDQKIVTGEEVFDKLRPESEKDKNDLYNTFDNFKKAYYKQLDDLENKLKEKSPELQKQIDMIREKLVSIFAIDEDGKYANAKNRTSIDDIMDELLGLDRMFKNIKGPGAKQNAFSNNLKKFGQDIEKEMQRLGNVSPKYQEQIKSIQEQYDQINTGLMEKVQAGTLTPDDISKASQKLAELDVQFRQLLKDRKALYETTAQGSVIDGLLLKPGDVKNSKEALRDYIKNQQVTMKGDIKSNRAGTKFEWTEVLDDGQIQKVVASVNAATGAVRILKGEAASTGGVFSNTFKSMASGLAQYATYALSTHRVMSTFFSQFKQGFATLQEYDKALTTISYTMDVSKEQLSGMGEAAVSMAKDLKMSLTDTLSIYQIYANMKTSSEEIRETAMPTAILSNLSGVDASTAADQIQGVIQQFGLLEDAEASAAEQSMHVVDVFDKISSNIAMDYAKGIKTMAEAVEKTGAEAKEAGLSFEQLAALSAKVAERTRSEGSEIGGAIRTILVRLSKVGKMPGYEDEVSNEELSNASKSLHAIGVEVYDAQGNFRDFTTIVGELEEKWDSLSDAQRSNISYNVAATRQSEKFRNILVAYKEAMQLAAEATETNGNALANQEKYEQSISGRLQGIKTNWQTFWMDVADSAVVDGAISGLELLTKAVAGVGDVFGEAGEAVVAFGGFLASAFLAGNIPKVLNAIVEFGKSDKTLFQAIAASKAIEPLVERFTQLRNEGANAAKAIGTVFTEIVAAHPAITALIAAVAGFVAIKAIFEAANPSLEKLRSNAETSKSAYEEVTNKIDSLNQQLETTQSRINEINSQENISLVDQSELENLEMQNEYLQMQIELEKERQKVKQQEAIDDALKVVNKKDKNIVYYDEEKDELNFGKVDRMTQANSLLHGGEQRKKELDQYKKQLEELSVDDFEDTYFSTAEQKYRKRQAELDSLIRGAEQDVATNKQKALELYTELQEDGGMLLDSAGNAKYNDPRIVEFAKGMKALGKYILDYDKTDGQKQQEAIQESLSESWFSGYETSLRRAAKNSEDSVREIIKEMLKENADSFSGLTEMGMDSASMEDTLTQYFMNLFNPGRNIQVMKDVVGDQILSGIKDLNPRTIIEEGLDSDVDWFQSLNASEIEELFNAINNQEIDTSGWGIKEAKEYLESLKEVAPEIESNFSQMFAPDKKVPTTVSEYVDTFQSEINTISTTLEKLKTGDFKDNDIVDLIQSIPELGDKTDNLEEALSQYSLDSLKSTISKIWESVEKEENGITDLQKQYIQRIINGLMQSVDLSGLGQDAFSTALANYIGDTSKSTAGYKQEIAAKLSEKYGNDEYGRQAVITILADTSLAYASYEELVDRIESQEIIIQLREDDQSIKNIDDNLTTLQHEADRLQETQDYKIEIGMELNESDYRNLIRNAESQINELQNKISLRKKDISLLDPVEDAVLIKTYQDEIASAQSTIGNLYKSIPGWNKNINALPGTRIEKHQAALNRVLDEQQRKRDLKELGGQTLTGEDWDRTIRLLESNAKLAADKTNAAYEEAYNNHTDKREAFTESELTSINDAKNAEIEAMRQVSEARQSRRQAEIKPLTDELTELQSDALQYENAITSAENKRQKVSKKLYDGLIKNGKKQVKVLNDQKKKLKEQQKAVDLTHDEWLDLQSQIDDVDSSILSMESNLAGWQDAMDGLIISNAQALSSAITQAMSEINAATGLTMETMQELNKQFSDLEGHDMSTLFYRTPEGMDVNVDRMREFTQLEYDSVNSAFERQIANLTKLRDGVSQGSDAWASYNAQLTKVKNEQAMFFAEYQQQMESMSLYSQLTIAEGTENQGARYEAVQKRFKDFKEAFDKGRVGTDEFDAFASYINPWGVGDWRTFEEDYKKATRYITEEPLTGISNFLNDLKAIGMAIEDDNHMWTITMNDEEEAARKLGTSIGVVKDTLGMVEEYDGRVTIANSMTEAQLNASELKQELYEAEKAYIDMEHAGADSSTLEKQQERIDEVKQTISEADGVTDMMLESNQKSREDRFRDLDSLLTDYSKKYQEAMEAGEFDTAAQWAEDAQKAVDEFGLTLGKNMRLDRESLGRWIEAVSAEVSKGTIDAPMPQFDTEDTARLEAYNSSLEKVQDYYKNNEEAAQGYFDVLENYSRDELEAIKLHDGAYNIDSHEAEDALEALADASGLTQNQLSSLLDVLEAIGSLKLKPELDLSSFTSLTDQQKTGFEKINEWQNIGERAERYSNFDVNADVTQMTSDQIQDRLTTISRLRVLLDPDDTDIQAALDKLQEDAEIQAKIQTVIDTDSDIGDLDTLLGMSDEDLEQHIKAVYTEEGDAEAIIQRIQEIKEASDEENAITVKIDEEQLNGLITSITEAIGKLQELQTTADKGIEIPEVSVPEVDGLPLASNIVTPTQEIPLSNETALAKIKEVSEALVGLKLPEELILDINTDQANEALEKVNALKQAMPGLSDAEALILVKVSEDPDNPLSSVINTIISSTQEANPNVKVGAEEDTVSVDGVISGIENKGNTANGKAKLGAEEDESVGQTIEGIKQKVTSEKAELTVGVSDDEAAVALNNLIEQKQMFSEPIVLTITPDNPGEVSQLAENLAAIKSDAIEISGSDTTISVTITETGDTKELASNLSAINEASAGIPGSITVDANTATAIENLSELTSKVEEINSTNAVVDNSADTTDSSSNLGSLLDLMNEINNLTITIKVDTGQVDSARSTVSNFMGLNWTVPNENGSAPTNINIVQSSQEVKNVSVDTGDADTKLDQLLAKITNMPDVEFSANADTDDASGELDNLDRDINDTPDVEFTAKADFYDAYSQLTRLKGMIDAMPDVDISAHANIDSATASLNILSRRIDEINAKRISIGSSGGGEEPQEGTYTGTMLSPAHASGTAFNVRNYIPMGSANANGNVAIKEDQESLVNELGTESIIRNGQWFLIPGGMQTYDLKKGDIVLNHIQTRDLIEGGKALGHGKAYASGTIPGMNIGPAHAVSGHIQLKQSGTPTAIPGTTGSGYAKATSDYIKSIKNTSGANNKAAKDAEEVATVFDWVEIKMQRFADAVQDITDGIQDFVKYSTNLKNIGKAITALKQQMEVDKAAAREYAKKATSLTDKGQGFEYKDKDGKIQHYKITQEEAEAIQNGKIKIEDIPDKDKYKADAFNAYKEWFEKGKEAARTAADAERQISEMTIQKLQTISDRFDSEIGVRERKISLLESGMSADETRGRVAGTTSGEASGLMARLKNMAERIPLRPTLNKKEQAKLEKQQKKLQKGGNVDLLNRPVISSNRLKEKGFFDAGTGAATVFSSTFAKSDYMPKNFDKKNDIAINFTPILPDGTVMEKGKFDKYCREVVTGVRKDDKNLQIGAEFKGEKAIKEADKTAKKIHELQAKYYIGGKTEKVTTKDIIKGVTNSRPTYRNEAGYTNADSKDANKRRAAEAKQYKQMQKEEAKNIISQGKKAANLQTQLDQAVKKGDIEKYSKEWYDWKDVIAGCTEEINKSKEKIAEYGKSINTLKFDDLVDARDNIQNSLDAQQSNIELKQATGRKVTGSDYQKLINLSNKDTNNLNMQNVEAIKMRDSFDVGTEEWKKWNNTIIENNKQIKENEKSVAEWNKTIMDINFSKLTNQQDRIQENIGRKQDNIAVKQATGQKVTAKDYQYLINQNNKSTDNLNRQMIEARENMAKYDPNTDEWKKWHDILIQNEKQIKENEKSTAEWSESIVRLAIDQKQAALGNLQHEAAKRQSRMDIKAARGGDRYVASASDYKALDNNMSSQSRNIIEQNKLLTEQRDKYQKGSEKWREYNQQIQQNEQTLLDNEKAQIEWRKAIVNLPLEKAAKKTEKLGRALQILQNKLEIATSAAGKTRIIKEQQQNARQTLKTAQNAKTDTIANRNKDANEYALAAAEEMGLKNVKIKNGKLVKKNATKSEQKKIDQINKNRNMLLGNQKISLDGLDKNGKAYAAADRANYANTEGIDKATENAEDAFWEFVKNTGDYAEQLAQIPIDEAAKKAEKAANKISILSKQIENLDGISASTRRKLLNSQLEEARNQDKANQEAAKQTAKSLKSSKSSMDDVKDTFVKGLSISKEQKQAIVNSVNVGEEVDFSEFAENLTTSQIEAIQKYNSNLRANDTAQQTAKESKEETKSQIRDIAEQLARIPIMARDETLEKINKKEELAQARYNNVESPKSRKEQLDIRAKNAEDTKQEYLDAKQVAANYLNETKTAVLSGLEDSGLTDKQKDSITKKISKGLEVDTSNIDPNSDLFAFLEEYNAALETNKTATHDADMAVEEYQSTMQDITKLRFDNIIEWYDALKGIAKAKLNLDQSQQELLRARGKSEYGTAMENNLKQQQQDIRENQERSRQSIADIKAEFNITDEDMKKLKDVDLSKYKKGETFGGFDAEEAMSFFDRASAVQQILGLQAEIKDDEVAFIQLQDTIDNMSLLELQGQMDRLQNGAYTFDENMRLVGKDGKSLSKDFVPSADALSDAMDMMSIRGRDVTVAMGQISRNYEKQITNSKAQVSNLEDQNVILREQMKGLEIGSEKYEEKAKQIWANSDAIREEQKRQEELNNALLHLPLDKLEKQLELLQSIAQLNKSLVDLTQARGLDLSFNDYDIQIKDNNAQIVKLNQELAKTKEYWDLAAASADKVYDGKSVTEWEKEWNSLSVSINNLKADNEALLDSLRNDIYFRNLERAKEAAEDFRNALSTLADLINEDMAFEDTGGLTEFGAAKASALLRDLQSNNQSIEIALARRQQIEKLYEDRTNNGYSELEYLSDLRDAENQLQDAIKGTYQARQNVLGLVETQGRKELESINKLIDARKEALQKKKDYYDYDKQLKGQTKEIQLLQQQIRALENVGDAESKAQKQRLEAQLKESQDALDDTVFQHTLDLSTEGLDKVSENLQENLDQFLKDLQRDLGLQADVINNATEAVGKVGPAVEASVNKLLTDFNPKITIESTGLTADSNKSTIEVDGAFASGTRNVPRNGLYKLNEGGRQEIITLPDGSILMPLSKGSGVINANLTSKLMDIATNYPAYPNFMSTIPAGGNVTSNTTVSFDSLITINGNVDESVIPQIENIAKELMNNRNFKQNMAMFTSKQIAKDMRKGGL